MALTPGTRLGPYEIRAVIGAGGMGEVYRARDVRLERDVAVKILPEGFASDASARERFQREARTIAALNHPHICTLHDIGQEGETSFLVMELVEGETLAGLIAGRPIPLATALTIAGQIADALDKAHRAGIAHRDLKPANVMLTKQRGAVHVKLLDFGLAKPAGLHGSQSAPGAAALTMTASPALTAAGSIVGTLHYMAPEQLEGQDADPRSDIWAFGCVLYEMLTGARPFEGKSSVSLMAAILEHEPAPIATRQPSTPPSLDHIITRCLAKDPEARWQSARDLAIELRWTAEGGGNALSTPAAPRKAPSPRRVLWWAAAASVAALAALAGAAAGARWLASPVLDSDGPVVFEIEARSTQLDSMAASPDGRFLVYEGSAEGGTGLLLREIASTAVRSLPGTQGAGRPFWSPDSRSIAFFTTTELRRVNLNGANSVTLAQMPVQASVSSASGSWGDDGQILFGQILGAGIRSVGDDGGAVSNITSVRADNLEQNHLYPQLLPGSRAFLYLRTRGVNLSEESEVVFRSLDTGEERILRKGYSRIEFAPPNWLVHTEGQNLALVAQRFDLSTGAMLGESSVLAPSILRINDRSPRPFTTSRRLLAYRVGRVVRPRLMWLSRAGIAGPAATTMQQTDNAVIDSSAELIAVNGTTNLDSGGDIWLADVRRGTVIRLTLDPSSDSDPVFAPDGKTVAFLSTRSPAGLYRKLIGGGGREESLALTGPNTRPRDWSRDGRHIVYEKDGDLWLLTLGTPPNMSALIAGFGLQQQGQFSPDARKIAYTSTETGIPEVFVQDFPVSGARWPVSSAGGSQPRWRADGRELYYLAADGQLMAVAVMAGPDFKLGVPQALFQTGLMGLNSSQRPYGVLDNGQRFLMNVAPPDGLGMPITVVVNWQQLLERTGGSERRP